MLKTLSTAFDIEHVLHPFDKDVTGHRSWLDKLAGGTVLVVGGFASLGIIPAFYFYTSYRKTHYWNHTAERLNAISALEQSMIPTDTKKAKLVGERSLIHQHLLKQFREQMPYSSFEEMKNQIEKSHFELSTKDSQGQTLFHSIAQFKNPSSSRDNTDEVLKLLNYLETKIPSHLNAKTNKGSTPLALAIENKSEKLFLELLKNPNLDVNETNQAYLTPLQQLIKDPPSNVVEMAKALIAHPKFDLAANCKQPPKYTALLSSACRARKADLILLLLSQPGSELINQPNPDFVPVIKELLYFFERLPNPEALALLGSKTGIEYGKEEDNNGSLVHYAIKFGKFECAKTLLMQPNANVNEPNKWGRTPLDRVPEGSELEKFLIEKGGQRTIAKST